MPYILNFNVLTSFSAITFHTIVVKATDPCYHNKNYSMNIILAAAF